MKKDIIAEKMIKTAESSRVSLLEFCEMLIKRGDFKEPKYQKKLLVDLANAGLNGQTAGMRIRNAYLIELALLKASLLHNTSVAVIHEASKRSRLSIIDFCEMITHVGFMKIDENEDFDRFNDAAKQLPIAGEKFKKDFLKNNHPNQIHVNKNDFIYNLLDSHYKRKRGRRWTGRKWISKGLLY